MSEVLRRKHTYYSNDCNILQTMNSKRLQMTKEIINYVRILNTRKWVQMCLTPSGHFSTFTIDAVTNEPLDRHRTKIQRYDVSEISLKRCTTTSAKNNVSKMSATELDKMFTELISKNSDKHIKEIIVECENYKKYITFASLKMLYKHYSLNGNPEMVLILQSYCSRMEQLSYKRNGEFLHYLAKAQCLRGNSEIGLTILKTIYGKYESLRSYYRLLFRDLIQDSVLNRSEASLMIFKKYVLEFSEEWSEHYPLVCFWHICWASTWFSDQMLSNELLEASEHLQDIVNDKATAISISALKDYNEDAVVRLLQNLLKYDMMSEYVAVLQVLFNYKLRNRDIRGCTEIIRNCEVLGVRLPSSQQGRYLTMLIEDRKNPDEIKTKLPFKNFKLKF